jgi:hypothetical protein
MSDKEQSYSLQYQPVFYPELTCPCRVTVTVLEASLKGRLLFFCEASSGRKKRLIFGLMQCVHEVQIILQPPTKFISGSF